MNSEVEYPSVPAKFVKTPKVVILFFAFSSLFLDRISLLFIVLLASANVVPHGIGAQVAHHPRLSLLPSCRAPRSARSRPSC